MAEAQDCGIAAAGLESDRTPPGFESALLDLAAEAFGDYMAWSETVHRRAALDVERKSAMPISASTTARSG